MSTDVSTPKVIKNKPNPFFMEYAPTVEKFFQFAEAGGYPAARELLYTLRRQKTVQFKAEGGLNAPTQHLGMGWAGDPDAAYTRRKEVLVLHWPTLLYKLPEFILEGNPEITAFVWQFNEIIRHKSLVLHDFLKRQIEQNISKFTMETPTALPLSENEKQVLGSRISMLTHKKMIRAFRKSFYETWGDRVDEKLDARRWAVNGTSIKYGEISLFDTYDFTTHINRCAKVSTQIPLLDGIVYPKVLNPWVYELCYAFGLNSKPLGTGTCRNPYRKNKPDCFIVNLGPFTSYRRERSAILKQFSASSPMELRLKFEEECPGIWYESGPSEFQHKAREVWPDMNDDNIMYIDKPKFIKKVTQMARMEKIRSMRTSLPGVPRNKFRVLDLTSPMCSEQNNVTFKVQFIRKGRYNYICPNWPLFKQTEPGHPGTVTLPTLGATFYRYSVLAELDPEIINSSSTLREWLQHLDSLSKKGYRILCKAQERLDRVQGDRERMPNFTEEQISAITRMVRPRMTEDDKKYLQDFCDGRSWKKIMLKAKEIRIAMIKKGIRDVTKVPHLNYNARLKKEFKDAAASTSISHVEGGEVGDVETIV